MLVDTVIDATRKVGLDLYFYPANDPASALIYFHGSRLREAPTGPAPRAVIEAGPHWTDTIPVGDVRWTMIAVPIPGGPGTADRHDAWMALLFGLFVSAIGSAYIWASGRDGERLQIANAQLDRTLGTLHIVNDELSRGTSKSMQRSTI